MSLHPAKDFTHGTMFVSVVSLAEMWPSEDSEKEQSSLAQETPKETINVVTAAAEVMGQDQTNHRT